MHFTGADAASQKLYAVTYNFKTLSDNRVFFSSIETNNIINNITTAYS